MFTGIVSEVGTVVATAPSLRVLAPRSAPKLAVGGSIAVNGACLTAVRTDGDAFEVEVVDETRRRTNLGALGPGGSVNLELPLEAGRPLDGHLVQGHVDGTAAVVHSREVELGRETTFELPPDLRRYVAAKGSIAVDGVSLTVAALDDESFTVALIPHTLQQTIAGAYAHGSRVNLEVDLLARYLERLVRLGIGER